MVKCVVSACPNRPPDGSRARLRRPKTKFFGFPRDPARVKVWLAALRETDRPDSGDERLICEDHFLPEDISADGVSADAIPIMPRCLDGNLDTISSWGVVSSEEEEDQWAAGGNEDDDEGGDDAAVDPCQQDSQDENIPEQKATSVDLHQVKGTRTRTPPRPDGCLATLTRSIMERFMAAPPGPMDLKQVTGSLGARRRRVNDIIDILLGVDLLEWASQHSVRWTGGSSIRSFLCRTQEENLKLVEEQLDSLITSCTEGLFSITDDEDDSALAYVTRADMGRLQKFQNQTLIVVKAPEETTIHVPEPTEDRIQVHLKAGGPVTVLTCEGENSCFVALEESRLHKVSSLQSLTG